MLGDHVAEPHRNHARWLTTQAAVVRQTLEAEMTGGAEPLTTEERSEEGTLAGHLCPILANQPTPSRQR